MTQPILRKLPREGAQIRPDRYTRTPGNSEPEHALVTAVRHLEQSCARLAEQVTRLRSEQRRLRRRLERLEWRQDAPEAEPAGPVGSTESVVS